MKKNMLALAISIAAKEFENKLDKGGKPYILHCLRVMNSLAHEDEEIQQIAVLHDLVEDTNYTINNLAEKGFSSRVCSGVSTLTHSDQEDYQVYIRRIAYHEDARKVKLADLRDNSDITRLKGLTKKDFDRMEKYQQAYHYLSKV